MINLKTTSNCSQSTVKQDILTTATHIRSYSQTLQLGLQDEIFTAEDLDMIYI